MNKNISYAARAVSSTAGTFRKKKMLAVFLAVCMVFAYAPIIQAAGAQSGTPEDPAQARSIQSDSIQTSISDLDIPDDSEEMQSEDILLEKYMMEMTVEESAASPSGATTKKAAAKGAPANGAKAASNSTDCLSTNSKRVYNQLKAQIKDIAAGNTSNSKVNITYVTSEESATSNVPVIRTDYTNAEFNRFIYTKDGKKIIDTDAFFEINNIDLELVVKALLADIPYEFYWFDKESAYKYSLGKTLSYKTDSTDPTIKILIGIAPYLEMKVSADYSQTGALGTYELNASKITRAKNAAARAASWVSEANSKYTKDYQKLIFFRKKICDAVSYHKNYSNANYGDIWQMISVFDNNSNTKVVCEGYAKAFRYLCDCSGIECLLVTGTMIGGTGAGAHMWNVVTLNGNNYLVDVTNCDTGSIGEPNKLFLKGRGGIQAATNIYEIAGKWGSGSTTITFKYDNDTKILNSPFNNPNNIDARLGLAASDYSNAGYNAEVTAEMQELAENELDSVSLGNYSGSELSKANQLIQNTKAEIANADTIEEIFALVRAFKAAMAQIRTNTQVSADNAAAAKADSDAAARSKASAAIAAKKAAFKKSILIAANKKVSRFSVKAKKKKKAVITWKPVSGVTGYEIMYSMKSNFSNAKKIVVRGAATKKYTIKKLKPKKKYFIGIRPYTTLKYNSSYSVYQPGKWGNAKKFKSKK